MENDRSLFETIEIFFTRITTIITICAALFIAIFWGNDTELNWYILLQIPLVGLLTAVPCAILFLKDNLSKKSFLIRNIIFYIYVNIIVFVLGILFDWIRLENKLMLVGMFFDILIVFLAVGIVSYLFDSRTSVKLNKQLEQFRNDESLNENE